MLRGTENKDKLIWVDLVYKVNLRTLGTVEQGRPGLVTCGAVWAARGHCELKVDDKREEVPRRSRKGLNPFYLGQELL